MERTLNVGLVGYGLGGRVFHAPIIESIGNMHLHSMVIRDPLKGKRATEKYPWIKVVNDLDGLLDIPEIDLVVISTPHMLHKAMVEKALLAGKHVVVDKPFTVNTAEADQLIELAKEKGSVLTVYQNRRWDSDFLTVKKIIQEKLLGNLVEYEAHFDRFRREFRENSWKEENLPGGGILYDLGSHLIDQAVQLFGLPHEITGDVRIQRPGGKVADYFQVLLGYPSLKVTLQAGMLVREVGPHFLIKGDRGSFVKYGMDVQEEMLKRGLSPLEVENWGEEPPERWGILNTEIKDLHFRGKVESLKGDYRRFYKNVWQAIFDKEELQVKPQEARNVIALIELAIKSCEQKRTIPIHQKEFL